MQAADFFSALSLPTAQAQTPGRGGDAVLAFGGLFAPADGAQTGLFGEGSEFAEQLMAVLGVVVPQQPTDAAPAPKGDGANLIEAEGRGPKAPIAPTLLALAREVGLHTDIPIPETAPAAATIVPPAAPTLDLAPEPVAPAVPATASTFAPPAEPDAKTAAPMSPEVLEAALAPAPTDAVETAPLPAKAQPIVASSVPVAPPPAPAATPAAPVTASAAVPSSPASVAPDQAETAPAPTAQPSVEAQVQTAAQTPRPAPPETGRPAARTKAEAPAAVSAARAEGPAPVASAGAAPEEALTETAVAAVSTSPDADDAPVADEGLSGPAVPPAHAEARVHSQGAPLDAPKATPQTVALLSAQIAKGVESKSTRFEVQLHPEGLGKVDVRIEIKASGDIRAELSFESPLAASELRARSGELQTALERAGFDASKTQLSFNSGNQGGAGQFADGFWREQQQQQQQQQQHHSWRGAAFMDLGDAPGTPVAAYAARERDGGVDVRI